MTMVLPGTVLRVEGGRVTFAVRYPGGDVVEQEISQPEGTTYEFLAGDEVFWWPVWDIGRVQEPIWPMQLWTQTRLVRRADVTNEELNSIQRDIEQQEVDARREAEHRGALRRRYETDGGS